MEGSDTGVDAVNLDTGGAIRTLILISRTTPQAPRSRRTAKESNSKYPTHIEDGRKSGRQRPSLRGAGGLLGSLVSKHVAAILLVGVDNHVVVR